MPDCKSRSVKFHFFFGFHRNRRKSRNKCNRMHGEDQKECIAKKPLRKNKSLPIDKTIWPVYNGVVREGCVARRQTFPAEPTD